MTHADDEAFVQAVAESLVETTRTALIREGLLPQSCLLVVSANGSLGLIVIHDPATHRSVIRSALAAVPDAIGYVLLYDGEAAVPGQPKREALLLVIGTRSGLVAGRAYPYERTPFGATFDAQPFEPLPDLLNPYLGLFRRAEPPS